jgi:molybdate transport system ATP-binding protein
MDRLPLVTMKDVTLLFDGRRVFPRTSWSIRPGEHWAILGPNGSGKSILARALWDGVPVVEGDVSWPLAESALAGQSSDPQWQPAGSWPASCVRHVSFDDQARRITRYSGYLQGRYESLEDDCSPTVAQALAGRQLSAAFPPLEGLLGRLGMLHTLRRPVSRLSNGELRKFLLVEALLAGPLLLVLDEPLQGLDRRSCRELGRLLRTAAGLGVTMVIVTSRERDLPDFVGRILRVDGAEVAYQGPREGEHPAGPARPSGIPTGLPLEANGTVARGRKRREQPVVELRDVTVRSGGTTVLDRVNWRIRAGEAWALTGPNGSGKTTLLSLIIGDHPQAYANDVRVFGRRRGEGQSIWEIREQVGHVSPEAQALFPGTLTVEDAILSGFFDGFGSVIGVSPSQRETSRQWAAALGLAEAGVRTFAALSDGQKRLVRLARAMVKRPRLLVLDEPCQGLDEEHRAMIIGAIEALGRSPELSIVYVTHEPHEIPSCVHRHLTLHRGRARRRPVWRSPRRLPGPAAVPRASRRPA